MNKPLRILVVMDPGILVPPKGYGGIERIVDMIARAYADKGHQVDLLVTKGSDVKGCTIFGYGEEGFPQSRFQQLRGTFYVWNFLRKNGRKYNLIHNFGRLAYLIPVLNTPSRKIQTYQREINPGNIIKINQFKNKHLHFTGCSADLISRTAKVGHWTPVHNGVEFNFYALQERIPEDAPFFFLGRIERVKGCHTAIAAVKATGQKLVIAGNISPLADELKYFKTEVEPFIDGDQIKYIGAVNDDQKNEWLGKSKAMLFPIEWNEPFGIVMPEAMACGTPVIAYEHGSVAEVIEEGVTGFKCHHFKDFCAAMEKIDTIDRRRCREEAMLRFDAPHIAEKYLAIGRQP